MVTPHPHRFLKEWNGSAGWIAVAAFFLWLGPASLPALSPDPPLVLERALNSGGKLFDGCLMEDRDGFFWIATQSGVLKWDGYALKKPKGSPEIIYTIFEDSAGLIWVSSSVGLSVYDKSLDAFTVFVHDPQNPKSVSDGTAIWAMHSIAEDSKGRIWYGTANGLNQYDKQTNTFTVYTHNPNNPKSLGHSSVTAAYVDRQGTLWIGTEGGLDQFDASSGAFTHYQNDPKNAKSLSSNLVTAVLEDGKGVLWVGTKDGGLNRLDKASGTFTRYSHDPRNSRSLGDNFIFSIAEAEPGRLWITHWDNTAGLEVFNTETEVFHHYLPDPAASGSASFDQIANVYKDRRGIIWVVRFNGILDKIDPAGRKFTLYQNDPKDNTSLAENSVFGVYQDRSGTLWVSFASRGVDKFDRQTNSFTHYPDMPGGLAQSMREDDAGLIWMAGNGGIFSFDKASGTYSSLYPLQCNTGQTIIPDRTRPNILWVGTDTGLVRFDTTTKKWKKFRHDPGNPDSISHDTMWNLFMDKAGLIWIPTYGGGLDQFDPVTERVVAHYKNNPEDSLSLGSDTLNHVYQDSSGRIWVGTVGSGLNRLNADGRFTRYNEETGFLTNWVGSILEDNQGFLWLGTKVGLVKFDPKSETWRLYTQADGLQGDEFQEYPNLKAKDGELWVFGGNGLNRFFPEKLSDNQYKPPVWFTSLTQGNDPLKDVKRAAERIEEISLDWQNNYFEFEAAALNFTKPERNQYQFFLEGFDKVPYNAGTKRTGRYSNLPDGTYTLRVRGSNNDGVWSDQEARLRVTVTGPFWRTTWFTVLEVLLIVGVAAAGVFWRLRAKEIRYRASEERKRELEQQVADRTAELVSANKELEAFAYSVSHDLRAPLRHVDGYVELLVSRCRDTLTEQGKHYVDAIADSARKMGVLIDELLRFSQIGRSEIHREAVDMNQALQDALTSAKESLSGRTVEWTIGVLPSVRGDYALLRQVWVNLLENAVKYTRKKDVAKITIEATAEGGQTIFRVSDNGIGFDMRHAGKLFGVFQRLHSQEEFEGTGIGLATAQRIIDRHGGRIWAHAEPDQGATFCFTLPE